ncbi:MAG TPA: multiheme c-type cytochrome [Thermoanaerobaculia bacterium]|nr:multiheme c-type cytochrome [Thermoanaerobaculia bacterium]
MKRVVFIAILGAAAAVAQSPSSPVSNQTTQPGNRATGQPGNYVGVATCVNSGCHGSTEPLNAARILQNEYYTWLNDDRHAQAYNILFNAQSARIARNMRLKSSADKEKICLDCHTTNVPAAQVEGVIDREDGVQCEVCHGAASGWRAEHTDEGWTHEQSVARGMIDLRDLPVRAHTCHRCHLGNADKEVDHELIASGHPILAFELDNFTESMPAHWSPGRDTHGARAWATGQVMKFRDSLTNLARHARGDEWPEFSDMSCHNCHHGLKNSQWRQERGWPGRAGLPTWSPQHWAMLRLILGRASASSRDELEPLVAQLARGVARMNDPAGVAATAGKARAIVHALVPKVDALRWNDSDIRALMSAIAGDRAFIERSDVHAAEQSALALQSLASALTRRNPRMLRSPLMKSIDALFEELKDRDDYDPSRFAARLQAVKAAL